MTTISGAFSHQWAGRFGACDAAKIVWAVLSCQDTEAAKNTSNVDVDQQVLGKSAGGEGLPYIPLPDTPLPNILLPNVPLPEARRDCLVGKE
jgi:hypothetical protein